MSGEHVFKFSLQYIIWQCTVYIVLLATSAQQLRVLDDCLNTVNKKHHLLINMTEQSLLIFSFTTAVLLL